MHWRVAFALAAAMLPLAGSVRAADPSEFSVAERRLFIDDHLRRLPSGKILEYAYAKRGSLENPIDDTTRITV